MGGNWILEIRSGGVPLDLHKVDKDRVIIGDISEPCSFRFKRGNEEAHFDVSANLLGRGGELVVAFITKPALLNKEVSLVDGETRRIERFEGYDEARAHASGAWRKLSKEEIERVRRAVFYRFVPNTDNDPVAEIGYYFDPVRP